eukprot:18522-Amphidinium_carterae.1
MSLVAQALPSWTRESKRFPIEKCQKAQNAMKCTGFAGVHFATKDATPTLKQLQELADELSNGR